jgi:hypothetical protein
MTTKTTLPIALLVALVLAVSACSAGGGDDEGEGDGGGGSIAAEAAEVGAEAAPAATEASGGQERAFDAELGPSTSSALPPLGPRVIQTASVRLRVRRDRFEDAVDEARTVAAGLGGFVVSSTASQEGRGRLVRGSLVVRVPARHYARAMSSLARLGRVEAREESSADVSQEFVDLEARARHLEAVERQFLALLDRAESVSATLAVQARLNETQLELERVRGRLRFLEDQTGYATISLSIREHLPPAARPGDRGWGILDAWRDGARAFVHVAGRAFVVAASAAPLIILAALGLLAVRLVRRRPLFRWGASGS